MEALKAGTRCECWENESLCISHWDGCRNDAVCMVTVKIDDVYVDAYTDPKNPKVVITPAFHDEDVPMCAPCAEYHESKGV